MDDLGVVLDDLGVVSSFVHEPVLVSVCKTKLENKASLYPSLDITVQLL